MAKTTTGPTDAKPKRRLPEKMTPEVAQAVLEDAVLEAAADIAALTATLDASVPNGSAAANASVLIAETPEEEELLGLIGVPYLGPSRVSALAEAGIKTLEDLSAATSTEIGGVKGVGMRNAERIKDWLAAQAVSPPAPETVSEPTLSPATDSIDPSLASANQRAQDLFERLASVTERLKSSFKSNKDSKRVVRQLERLDDTSSLLAEGPDTLTSKQVAEALDALDGIIAVLEFVADSKPLSPKKQDLLADRIKASRKGLEKTLQS